MKNVVLLAGNANFPLAQEIAKKLGIKLAEVRVSTFSDSEIDVQILENMRGRDAYLIQGTNHPANDNLMELLILTDALKRSSANRITAVIPYYGYARQDRKAKGREPITAKLVADLIQTAGAHRVIAVELHSGQIQGFFNIPLDNLTTANLIAQDILAKKKKNVAIVSPDIGGTYRARALQKRIDCPLLILEKRRQKVNQSEVLSVIGDPKGKTCFIIDDMIDTGGSVCGAAETLLQNRAREVYVYCTHGIFSGPALERIQKSKIQEVVCMDTIPLTQAAKKTKKVRQISVAELLAEALRRTIEKESVSELFKY